MAMNLKQIALRSRTLAALLPESNAVIRVGVHGAALLAWWDRTASCSYAHMGLGVHCVRRPAGVGPGLLLRLVVLWLSHI